MTMPCPTCMHYNKEPLLVNGVIPEDPHGQICTGRSNIPRVLSNIFDEISDFSFV